MIPMGFPWILPYAPFPFADLSTVKEKKKQKKTYEYNYMLSPGSPLGGVPNLKVVLDTPVQSV